MTNIIDAWKRYMQFSMNYSKNTVESYAFDISLLERFLKEYSEGEITINNLNKQTVRAWILYRYQNENNSARSVSRGLSALKNLHRFMIAEGVLKNSEILNMRPPKLQKTLPRPISIEQLNGIIGNIEKIKNTQWIIKRDKALLLLIYSVGLRISEALNLKTCDIVNENGGFLNILGKGGKERMVPFIDCVREVISEYIASKPLTFTTSEYLFINRFGNRLHETSVQKLFVKIRRMLGLSEIVTPHTLRHTCATHIMENSGDLRGIQELLGHASVSSTEIYADITKKYITDIYEKCHPLSKKKNT